MSAGSGIVHCRVHASARETCHLLQIWIMPSKSGMRPAMNRSHRSAKRHNHLPASLHPIRARMKCGWCRDAESGPPSWMPASKRSITGAGPQGLAQVAKGEVKLGGEP